MNRQACMRLSLVCVLVVSPAAFAQLTLSWYTVDGGGRIDCTGGTFSLRSTIGQPDAGPTTGPMTGGTYSLAGGFWRRRAAAPPSLRINEIRIDEPNGAGGDVDEYFEIAGPAATSLSGYWYVVIGDGPRPHGSGVIEEVIDLSSLIISPDGHLLVTENSASNIFHWAADFSLPLNFENNDNVTHLLVRNFSGTLGQDLDTDDNGTLDAQPWSQIDDCVSILQDSQIGDRVYCATTVGPVVGASRNFSPGHVYRLPDATGPWQIGPFDPAVGDDTPGAANAIAVGACCNGATCTPNVTKSACAGLGGTWAGPGTVCSPNVCMGACCVGPACSAQTQANCISMGGFYRGGGTVCADVDCACDRNVKLNEIWAGDPVTDDVEYIELYMPPCGAGARGTNHNLAGMSLIVVDGDTEGDTLNSNYKRVSYRADFGQNHTITDGGFVVIGSIPCTGLKVRDTKATFSSQRGCTPPVLVFGTGTLENGSQTYALVRTQDLSYCTNQSNPTVPPAGCQSDVDSHRLTDSSVADITANQIDSVATTDTNTGDHAYFNAPVVKDGIHQATQLQRTQDGYDTDQAVDWEVQWHLDVDDPSSTSSPGLPNVQGTGACCVSAICHATQTQTQCAALGGTYQGNGTACTPNPCAGACCVAGSCTDDQMLATCVSAGGAYMGDGITCAQMSCAGVTIAQARALGTGVPVILNDVLVASVEDVHGHADYKAFELQDSAPPFAALTVFGSNSEINTVLSGVTKGDTIDLAGTTNQWNGLFQLSGGIAPLKRVQFQDTNASVGESSLAAADFQNSSATAEANESRIAVLPCMVLLDGGTGIFQADHSYLATDGIGYVSVVVPASAMTLVGQPIPTGSRLLRGIFWQSDFNLPTDTPPDNAGYRLVLRTLGDIQSPNCADPLGACCVPSGGCACSQTTQANCLAAGGTWMGGACSPATLCQNDPSRMAGDIDGDSDVDVADAAYFVLAILGFPAQPAHSARADLNCDSVVNGLDVGPMVNSILP